MNRLLGLLKASFFVLVSIWEYVLLAAVTFLINDHTDLSKAEAFYFFMASVIPLSIAFLLAFWSRRERKSSRQHASFGLVAHAP